MNTAVTATRFLAAVILSAVSLGSVRIAAQDVEIATALSMTEGPAPTS